MTNDKEDKKSLFQHWADADDIDDSKFLVPKEKISRPLVRPKTSDDD